MHKTSLRNMKICYDKYITDGFLDKKEFISVLELVKVLSNINFV